MAPVLPGSLSPHICVLCSPDLELVLKSSSLPPLAQILQSFSPLSQVTTRTTTLSSVAHSSFALRFSDLVEIEDACKEDEEERAIRTIDWIGARISQKSVKWIQVMDNSKTEGMTTPWWEELKKCSEGNHTPSKHEGWNHPVAVVFAVSTTAANPLQALQDLHSRQTDFPSWVDSTYLRCSLIVHPQNSPLSDPITDSLFNAVKKQHGLHSYLLRLSLPVPPPPNVSTPALPPRLPPVPTHAPNHSTPQLVMPESDGDEPHNLRMIDIDQQATARVVREFTVMSLIPWMEKCVLDWNDNYASSRRLPSRLFSSTRRLFGSASVSSASVAAPSPSPYVSSHAQVGSQSSITSITSTGPPAQQRRLAEFATILGDYKLAITIWESVRKEGRGGSEVLPLLLAPSPAVSLHAAHAIKSLHPTTDLPAFAQLQALSYSVRWDIGINKRDFLSDVLGGEEWLVWAAGSADEPPAAILLAQAAQLSLRKGSRRRAALWYLFAANRLEKYGIKPLTTYLLRRAHMLYQVTPEKSLSPSFWESEEKDPAQWRGFDAIVPGIEHALGRLLYTTGDTEGAVRLFLGLLTGSALPVSPPSFVLTNGDVSLGNRENTDRVFLDDFRVAVKHLIDTSGGKLDLTHFKFPSSFCVAKQTKIRLPSDSYGEDLDDWIKREDDWRTFWKARGKERLDNKKRAVVNEAFWADFVLYNPLDAEVELTNFTTVVREAGNDDMTSTREYVDVEVISRLVLRARETRTVPIQVMTHRPAALVLSQLTYQFFSLLTCTESLATRGRRVNETATHRQNKTYAEDVYVQVDVEDCGQRLHVNFMDERPLSLAQGERRLLNLWMSNTGIHDIEELWLVTGSGDEVWIDLDGEPSSSFTNDSPQSEVIHSNNSIIPQEPLPIPLEHITGSSFLAPGSSLELPIIFHADRLADQNLCLLFVFRQAGANFNSAKVMKPYQVVPLFEISMTSTPSRRESHTFILNLEIQNVTNFADIHISQITTMSAFWSCTSVDDHALGNLNSRQLTRATLGVRPWEESCNGPQHTREFVRQKLGAVIRGQDLELSHPPSLDILCTHFSTGGNIRSVQNHKLSYFVHSGKRNVVRSYIGNAHPNIPAASYPYLFPLYNPSALDMIVFWEIPFQHRSGHVFVSGLRLGAGHSDLQGIIDDAENIKAKRSMYAETRREKMEILEAVRHSEWNVNMNPIVVMLHDCAVVKHDFSTGPCCVPVTFVLSNCSLTRPSRFVFRLISDLGAYPPSSDILPPQYSGRRSFRGLIEPCQMTRVHTKVWIAHPGTYSLDGWELESEVEDRDDRTQEGWQAGHRYVQGPPKTGDLSCITVVAV